MNEELKGVLYISRSHSSSSHMWNSDTLCHYLEFLSAEIHRKRVALNLPFEAKALILCDAAAVHSCSLYSKVRDRFEKDTNSLLIHGGCGTQGTDDDRLSIPGGWGACGAPNDAWHQWYHYLRRAYMRVCTGMCASTKIRKALGDMEISIDGNTRISKPCPHYAISFVFCCLFCLKFLQFSVARRLHEITVQYNTIKLKYMI